MSANRSRHSSPATAEKAAAEAAERRIQQLLAPFVERIEALERAIAELRAPREK